MLHMKQCASCKQSFPLSLEYFTRRITNGKETLRSPCITCRKKQQKEWRDRHSERQRQRAKEWRKKNPERHKANMQRWYAINKNTYNSLRRGDEKIKLYNVWHSMIRRCTISTDKAYKNYGARGIAVCEKWQRSFESFMQDMGERPQGYTLERRDNDVGYGPENCYWASRAQQSLNTRRNNILEYHGVKKSLSQWAQETGISRATIESRLKRHWSIDDALEKTYDARRKQ